MKHVLMIVIGVLSVTNVFSQNFIIKGTVRDSLTNENIEYANIAVLNSDLSFIKGTVSDSLGQFFVPISSLEKSRNYILQINHLNYNKKCINLSNPQEIQNIRLSSKDILLSEAHVTGKYKIVSSNANGFKIRVTDKMRDGALVATQLLENVPSVYVDYNKNVYIKGSSNILILKDGKELSSTDLVNQIIPESIESIEITTNVPSKYAANHYTAIMNINTKRVENKSVIIDNNSSFDKQMYDLKLNLNLETKRHSLYLYYKLYYRNFLEKYSVENRDITSKDSISFFRVKPRKECDNEFFYGYSFYKSKKLMIGFDGYLSLYRENFAPQFDNVAREDYSNSHDNFNTQNYKLYSNYKDSLNLLNIVFQYNHKRALDTDLYYRTLQSASQKEQRNLYEAQADYQRTLKDNIQISTGVDYSYIKNSEILPESFLSENILTEKYHENNLSAYAESNINLNKWGVSAGFNVFNYRRSFDDDNIKVNTFSIYPKASVAYNMNNDNSLKLSYYSYINTPSIWNMLPYTRQISPNLYFKGNPNLKPEENIIVSSEYSYSKGDFYFSNELYLKTIKNKVQDLLSYEDNATMDSKTNLRRMKDIGWDMSLSFNPIKCWKLNLYNDLFYRRISENTYYKKHLLSISGNVTSSWDITKKLGLMLQYQYNTRSLVYNGFEKMYSSSMAVVQYSLLKNLDIYFMAIQPVDQFEKRSLIYDAQGMVDQINNVKVRTYLISFTYNIFNSKKKHKNLYENESKKY